MTFTLIPSRARRPTSGIEETLRVLVMGIFTFAFSPHESDLARLPFHIVHVVGEHLERDRPSRITVEDFASESLVVA